MTNTPSGTPESNIVDPNDVISVPQSAPDVPQSAPDVTVDMCKWWLTAECGLNDADADALLNVVTDNGNKPLSAKRFYRAYVNKSNEVQSAGGNAFPQIGFENIGAKFLAAHPAPDADFMDVTDTVDVENPPNATSADPNATPADPSAPSAPTVPGEPMTPDQTQGMPVTPDPNSPTAYPEPLPIPVIGGPALMLDAAPDPGRKKIDALVIAGAIGLAVAAAAYGIGKAKGCNDEQSDAATVSAAQTASPAETASASATPAKTAEPAVTPSPTAKESQEQSWLAQNLPQTAWVKCDNFNVPTDCVLPVECRMNNVTLSRPASFRCTDAEGKWITYATPHKAEHTYPRGNKAGIRFELQEK